MTQSLILRTAIRYLWPLILIFAVFVLLRGHNYPGGGFVGGLLAASAFALYYIGFGVDEARKLLKFHPISYIAAGLAMAAVSTLLAPMFTDLPFMTSLWGSFEFPAVGKLSTPLLFDTGVCVTVLGVVLQIVFTLAELE
jgi:multicomponent Na+:H+ antiporter subunit B